MTYLLIIVTAVAVTFVLWVCFPNRVPIEPQNRQSTSDVVCYGAEAAKSSSSYEVGGYVSGHWAPDKDYSERNYGASLQWQRTANPDTIRADGESGISYYLMQSKDGSYHFSLSAELSKKGSFSGAYFLLGGAPGENFKPCYLQECAARLEGIFLKTAIDPKPLRDIEVRLPGGNWKPAYAQTKAAITQWIDEGHQVRLM